MTTREVIEKVEKDSKGLMTAEDIEKWNAERIKDLKPLRPGHWTHKRARRIRLIRICLEWRHWCQYWRAETYKLREQLKDYEELKHRMESLEK